MATAKEKREAREQALRDEGAAAARKQIIAETNKAAITDPGSVAPAKAKVATPQSAGAKVIVACKLGVAYYDIQHSKIVDKFEQNMQGGRTVKEAERVGQVVRLRGTAYPRGTPPVGFPPAPEIVDGAALNYGVDKDWFDAWLEQNKMNPIVQNRMIFAHETIDGVRGEAKELGAFLSGLEPVNPGKDRRIPKSTREEVSDVETEEARKKKLANAAAH